MINTSPNDVILSKNWHLGEMTPLSYADKFMYPSSINKVIHDINPDTISTKWTQLNNDPHTICKAHNNLWPKPYAQY